ncbi:MAG: hypothetical protein EHM24_26155, partial [Acidobacteria bacterium]
MKIRTCRIEGFGIFNEWTLAGLPDGLTVIYGDNEAGKSTLLAFLRGVLFGFPPRSGGEEQYAPLRGGRFGGSLEIDLPSGIYRVERTSTRRARRFTLLRPDGTQGEDEGELRRLLGGADASLFKSVFAFDLAELSQLQQLSRSEIANSIFSAGIAGGGRPARSVLDVLDKEAQQLLKPKGSAKINELVAEMKQVRAGIERARSASATYPEVLAAESDAGAEIARLKDEIGRHEGQRRRLARLVEYWPVENDRRQLGNQLAGLDVVDDFPPDPHARLASALAALSSAEAAARTANASLSECAAARRKLAPDDRLQAVAPQVSALAEAITLQRERLRQKARNAIAIEGSERDVRSANGNLGPGWTEQAVLSFDRSLPVVETVRGWQQQLDRAASAAAEARRNMLAANDEETRFEQRLAPLESQLQRQRAGTAAEFEPILAAAEALDGRTAADARRALGELRAAEGRLDGLVRSEADARGRLQRALIGSSSDRLKDESVALRRIRTR